MNGRRNGTVPMITGHEFAGEIVEMAVTSKGLYWVSDVPVKGI